MNPERLQETFAMPIKIPENFGANSIKFVDGPDVLKFAKVIAMVIITIAEVAVDAWTIATTKRPLTPAPSKEEM